MTEVHLSLVPKEPLPVKREWTEEDIAAYDAMRKVEDAMVRFIAHYMASPRNPYYGHIDDARNMLRHLKAIASVTPDIRKLKIYGYLDEEG